MTVYQKASVDAILEDDLKPILNKLGYLEKILEGEIKCSICNTVITLESISAMYKKNGEIKLVCDKDMCYNNALEDRS